MCLGARTAAGEGVEVMSLTGAQALIQRALWSPALVERVVSYGHVPDFIESAAVVALLENDVVLVAWEGEVHGGAGPSWRAD